MDEFGIDFNSVSCVRGLAFSAELLRLQITCMRLAGSSFGGCGTSTDT